MLWTKYSLSCLGSDLSDINYRETSYYEDLKLDDAKKWIIIADYAYFTNLCTDCFDFYIFTTNISYWLGMYDQFHLLLQSYCQIVSDYVDSHFHQHHCNDFYHVIAKHNKEMFNFTIEDFFLFVIMSGYD